MAKHVEGFVIVVAKDKLDEHQKMAEMRKETWMKMGALEYIECMGEDLEPKEMGGIKPLAFTDLTKAQPNETVWLSFIIYESKKSRDEVNA